MLKARDGPGHLRGGRERAALLSALTTDVSIFLPFIRTTAGRAGKMSELYCPMLQLLTFRSLRCLTILDVIIFIYRLKLRSVK